MIHIRLYLYVVVAIICIFPVSMCYTSKYSTCCIMDDILKMFIILFIILCGIKAGTGVYETIGANKPNDRKW